MNILPVSSYNISTYRKNSILPKQNNSMDIAPQMLIQKVPLLPKNYFLNFKGENDLSLAKTMQNFEEFAKIEGKRIPPKRVYDEAVSLLQNGNSDDMTLIDVHKKVYEDLKYADTLEEVKSLYPEFDDVLAVKDVEGRQGSFIDEVQQGNNEFFDKDEDLALQLLKLYWADGFSTKDLKKYSNGKNLAYTMKKLHIPMFNNYYAIVLKFSDKEYDDRIMEEMSARRLDNLEKNSENNADYVYIPRGKMPEEQKEKVSEALIKYYIKNPKRAYAPSLRQKEFYKNNPKEAEFISKILQDAWKLSSNKPVKETLQNFLRTKCTQKNVNDISDISRMDSTTRVLMQEFWDENPKAMKNFSESMNRAFKKRTLLKDIEKSIIIFPIPAYPLSIQKMINTWAEKNGYDSSKINYNLTGYIDESKDAHHLSCSQIVTDFFKKNALMTDIYGDTLICTLAALRDYILMYENNSPVGHKIVQRIESSVKGKKMRTKDLVSLYVEVAKTLISSNNIETLYKLGKMLNASYSSAINLRQKAGQPIP